MYGRSSLLALPSAARQNAITSSARPALALYREAVTLKPDYWIGYGNVSRSPITSGWGNGLANRVARSCASAVQAYCCGCNRAP